MLFAPPGSAKSTYVSVLLPSWYLANHPENSILAATHNVEFAERWGRRVRNDIAADANVLGISLSEDSKAAARWSLTGGGEYYGVGAGVGISGFRANLGVGDDLFGSREDAYSDTVRQKRWDWYVDDFSARLKPGAKRILMNTRWHEEDVAGRVLEQIERKEIKGRVISISAIAEENDPLGRKPGEYLWDDPDGYDYGAFLRARQRETSPMMWSALYQQRPAPEEGDYFKAAWLKPCDKLPARETMRIYGGSDYAVTADGGDYTVHLVVGLDPDGRMYLLDRWRKQSSSDEWIEAFCDLVLEWKPVEKERANADLRKQIANSLIQVPKKRAWDPLGKSGIRKRGGKPVTNGFGPTQYQKSQADSIKPIEQLRPAELSKLENRVDVGVDKNPGLQLIYLAPQDAESELDKVIAKNEGYGGRAAPLRDFQRDDGSQ